MLNYSGFDLFFQNICCPVTSICYQTPFTPSKIFCCNSTTPSECRVSKSHPPECPPSTAECSAETGGGCCPEITQCSSNGCIQVLEIQISSPTSTSLLSTVGSTTCKDTYLTSGPQIQTTTSLTSTITTIQCLAVTATVAKDGEVVQQGGGTKGSVWEILRHPYTTVLVLVLVAALMGML